MLEISRILCPVDFSVASDHAAAHAVAVARWFQSSISALHVYNPVLLPVPGLALAGYRGELTLDEGERRTLTERMQAVFEAAGSAVPVETRIELGPPQAQIVSVAAASKADLIVMGTHGTSGLEYLVLGSVTEHVLRHAPCPVLTVPPRSRSTASLPFRHLLVPVDFSDWSLGAVEAAWRLAQEADAHVTLLHAVDWTLDDELALAGVPGPSRPIERDLAEIRERLCRLVPASVREWCRPDVRVVSGRPFRAILQTAEETRADLIVMGVHGRSPLGLAMFGSTTNQIVRRALCPVLTLRR
jgi:nucleotide-binding universal stress UspA family protein